MHSFSDLTPRPVFRRGVFFEVTVMPKGKKPSVVITSKVKKGKSKKDVAKAFAFHQKGMKKKD